MNIPTSFPIALVSPLHGTKNTRCPLLFLTSSFLQFAFTHSQGRFLHQQFFFVFFFQGIILFCVTVVVIIAASFLREAIPLEDLAGLTWKTLHVKKKPASEPSLTGYT